MTYIDYRHRVEFGEDDYRDIDQHARERRMAWFPSPWDVESVDFLEMFDVSAHKVAPESLTDDDLLLRIRATGRTATLSNGMSTPRQIRPRRGGPGRRASQRVHRLLRPRHLSADHLGRRRVGSVFIERHIGLDRALWGSDPAACVEPPGLQHVVRDLRTISESLGDGVQRVYEGELGAMKKLRRVSGVPAESSSRQLVGAQV